VVPCFSCDIKASGLSVGFCWWFGLAGGIVFGSGCLLAGCVFMAVLVVFSVF
jgi:hypothetical protein